MRYRFLGGASEVGKVGLVMETPGTTVLFDYGFNPSKPPSFPLEAPPLDAVFLTHAHVDHSGMIPWLAGHDGPPVVATPPTTAMAMLLNEDSLKISKNEGFNLPFDQEDLRKSKRAFDVTDYEEIIDLEDISVKLISAGHIPGSTMYSVDIGGRRMLFTGDINTRDTHLVVGTEPDPCDILFVEGTYATREHPDRKEVEAALLAKVEEVLDRGGQAILPVFAVGRMQEVLMILSKLKVETWFDGMGRTVNSMLLEMPEYLRDAKYLARAVEKAKEVYSEHGRDLASQAEVVVTTSGMLEGGPVLEYIRRRIRDPKSAILLTGYQVKGTNGNRLVETGALDMSGVTEKVHCEVAAFDLSAHSGHSELVTFIKACRPEHVVLFHSDNREALAKDLPSDMKVHLPNNGDRFEID